MRIAQLDRLLADDRVDSAGPITERAQDRRDDLLADIGLRQCRKVELRQNLIRCDDVTRSRHE